MSDREQIAGVLPGADWWVLRRSKRTAGTTTTVRHPVVGFLVLAGGDGDYLEPTLPTDGGVAVRASELLWPKDADLDLWHAGTSWCHCRTKPHPADEVDDIWWCETCAGEIPRPQ